MLNTECYYSTVIKILNSIKKIFFLSFCIVIIIVTSEEPAQKKNYQKIMNVLHTHTHTLMNKQANK